jgi:hypothetical protein
LDKESDRTAGSKLMQATNVGGGLSIPTGKVVQIQRIALHVIACRQVIEREHHAGDLGEASGGRSPTQPEDRKSNRLRASSDARMVRLSVD